MEDFKFYRMLLKETKSYIKDKETLVEAHAALVSIFVKTMVMTFELNTDLVKSEESLNEYMDKHMEEIYKNAHELWALRMDDSIEPGPKGTEGGMPRWMLG
jgi:UDP-N-acetylglucosamine transferase subunit ALG13